MLTQEVVKQLLNYDPFTGMFLWAWRKKGVRVGCAAGSSDGKGYIRIKIDGKDYGAHRLAWLYVYGSFPENDIDHINGIRNDNRISNLRSATRSENMRNMGKQPFNTSGYKGVTVIGKSLKFQAQIIVNGKRIYLGQFKTAEEAHVAYCIAADKYHGEFARAY